MNHLASDSTIGEFFDRLQEALFPRGKPSPAFTTFRVHAEARERRGRLHYDQRFLTRDNCLEGTEEAADAAVYACFDLLCARRDGTDEEWGLALTAAQRAYELHDALLHLRARRSGAV